MVAALVAKSDGSNRPSTTWIGYTDLSLEDQCLRRGVGTTCQEAGIDDHMGKPFKISKLASKIEHLLAGSPSLESGVFTQSSALGDDPARLLFNSQQLQQIALGDLDFLL